MDELTISILFVTSVYIAINLHAFRAVNYNERQIKCSRSYISRKLNSLVAEDVKELKRYIKNLRKLGNEIDIYYHLELIEDMDDLRRQNKRLEQALQHY